MVSLLVVEPADSRDDTFLLFHGKFRENRKGEGFPAELLGYGEIPFRVAQEREAFLKMEADGIIHSAHNPFLFKESLEFVPAGHLDHVLVINVIVPLEFLGGNYRIEQSLFCKKGKYLPATVRRSSFHSSR